MDSMTVERRKDHIKLIFPESRITPKDSQLDLRTKLIALRRVPFGLLFSRTRSMCSLVEQSFAERVRHLSHVIKDVL